MLLMEEEQIKSELLGTFWRQDSGLTKDFSFIRSLTTPVTVSSSASPIAVENEYASADQQSSVVDDDD